MSGVVLQNHGGREDPHRGSSLPPGPLWHIDIGGKGASALIMKGVLEKSGLILLFVWSLVRYFLPVGRNVRCSFDKKIVN